MDPGQYIQPETAKTLLDNRSYSQSGSNSDKFSTDELIDGRKNGIIDLSKKMYKTRHPKSAEETILHEFGHHKYFKLKNKIDNGRATSEEKREFDKVLDKINKFHNDNKNKFRSDHDSKPDETYADKTASDKVGLKAVKQANKDVTKLINQGEREKATKRILKHQSFYHKPIKKQTKENQNLFNKDKNVEKRNIEETMQREANKWNDIRHRTLPYRNSAVESLNKIDKKK